MGKSIDDPAVADYKAKFPYHKLVPTERNTVAFETLETDENGEPIVYSVEALMAQVLALARTIASDYAETPISDAVICVPSTWSQTERLSMRVAAELAGIKVKSKLIRAKLTLLFAASSTNERQYSRCAALCCVSSQRNRIKTFKYNVL